MGKTVIGKLKEKLIVETDEAIIGYPTGTIVEVSSEDEYPHDVSKVAIEEIAEYLEKNANNVVWRIPEGQEVTSISAAIMRCCDDQQKKEIIDKLSRRIKP